jgi:hypothetical protein
MVPLWCNNTSKHSLNPIQNKVPISRKAKIYHDRLIEGKIYQEQHECIDKTDVFNHTPVSIAINIAVMLHKNTV